MQKATVKTVTGVNKKGDDWYAYTITLGDFTTELAFCDKIHYQYLKSLETPDTSVNVKTN